MQGMVCVSEAAAAGRRSKSPVGGPPTQWRRGAGLSDGRRRSSWRASAAAHCPRLGGTRHATRHPSAGRRRQRRCGADSSMMERSWASTRAPCRTTTPSLRERGGAGRGGVISPAQPLGESGARQSDSDCPQPGPVACAPPAPLTGPRASAGRERERADTAGQEAAPPQRRLATHGPGPAARSDAPARGSGLFRRRSRRPAAMGPLVPSAGQRGTRRARPPSPAGRPERRRHCPLPITSSNGARDSAILTSADWKAASRSGAKRRSGSGKPARQLEPRTEPRAPASQSAARLPGSWSVAAASLTLTIPCTRRPQPPQLPRSH